MAELKSKEKANRRERIGVASFSVSARVAVQLGRESISSSEVAIMELVKNSYDAEAENVWIRFSGLQTDSPILVIQDDGRGMTPKQFQENWMVIGTDNKANRRTSRNKKRVLVGEKGLGRLGLDRLGETTQVQAFSRSSKDGIELEIDWSKYEASGARLERVNQTLFSIPNKLVVDPITGEQIRIVRGLRLIIHGLKDTWTESSLGDLRRELSLLVSPFSGIDDFSIWLDSGLDLQDIDGTVGSQEFVEAAEWRLESTLSADGAISHMMSSRSEAEFSDTKHWSEVFRETGTAAPRCGPVEFVMYFIPREAIKELSLSRSQVMQFLDLNQGVRLYRDGFRVHPYGDPSGDGDWLNLGIRRTRSPQGVKRYPIGGWKVGYNQVVGAIFLERERNSALIDQTNREGIVHGPAFFDLRRFALDAVRFFEDRRQRYEISRSKKTDFERAREDAGDKIDSTVQTVRSIENLTSELLVEVKRSPSKQKPKEIRRLTSSISDAVVELKTEVEGSQSAQEEMATAAEDQQEEFRRQKDTLGNLASLGILAATFGHETLRSSNLVLSSIQLLTGNIEPALKRINRKDVEIIAENLSILEKSANRIKTFAEFTLKNIRRDKRTRVQVYLDKLIEDVFSSFEDALVIDRGIAVELDFPERFPPIRAFYIDWESIIINLITNSIWALEDTPRDERAIRVRGLVSNSNLQISYADSGIGIEKGTIDKVFIPTFSTKRNARGDVVGTGMGLAIVENLVSSYAGSVSVESPSELGGAEFRIQVPRRRVKSGGRDHG